MRLISFNLFRTLNIPGIQHIKPEHWLHQRQQIEQADWVLFPEYWQVNTLVYGYKKRIFPSISTYHLGHDKIQMTRVFEALYPAHVPQTQILAATDAPFSEVCANFDYPFVAKEPRNSMGNGVFLIQNHSQWLSYARANPVWYVQEYLPIERDLRVVVIGEQVIAAYWRELPPGGFHANVARGGRMSFTDIPDAALEFVQRIAKDLGINHAGFDIAWLDGHPYLIEFNLYFGNQGLVEQGIQPSEAISAYLQAQSDMPPLVPSHRPPQRQAA